MKHVVIIGGGTAGASVAFFLRKLNKDYRITIVDKSRELAYSHCSLPYVLSGEIKSYDKIYMYKEQDFVNNSINLVIGEVKKISEKQVEFDDFLLDFDICVIATGCTNAVPKIIGLDKFFTYKTIEDAKKIHEKVKKGSKIGIIGAGYVGVELAFELSSIGVKPYLFEGCTCVLTHQFDDDISEVIIQHLENNGVTVKTGVCVQEIKNNSIICGSESIKVDDIVLTCGVKLNCNIADVKVNSGILVNDRMQTSNKNIYAIGDIAETKIKNTKETGLSLLGSIAVLHAKVAADNIAGIKSKLSPIMNANVTRLGNLYFGGVGLTNKRAKELGIKTVVAKYVGKTKSKYHKDAKDIFVKLISNSKGKIIGAQMYGEEEVVGRLDAISIAIKNDMTAQDLAETEMCFNPASSCANNPLNMAAMMITRKLR